MANNLKTGNDRPGWIKNPTKKQLIFLTLIWLTGLLFLLLSMTNFFSESILNKKYFILYFLLLISVLAMAGVYKNYFKSRAN